MQMKKNKTPKYKDRIIPPYLILSISGVIVAALSYFFMTWLVNDIFNIEGTYIRTTIEVLGTVAFMVIMAVPMSIVLYRIRKKELNILYEGIQHLAEGDFSYKLPLKRRYSLAKVYENFNKMSEELQSVQILRNDFINSYSHEFKTPIASINGFAELLLDITLSDEEREAYLKIIVEETDRLSKLAANTILLSKLSSQQIVTDTEEYDIGEQIRQCSILLSQRWMEKNIEFTCALPSVIYKGNRELMQHLWINLISNAVEHTFEDGEIAISLQDTEEGIIMNIADSGAGMSEETLKHLFEPYFQADASRSSKGLGLGLSIVNRIVELCSGEITVESEIGKGSLFTVKLPK